MTWGKRLCFLMMLSDELNFKLEQEMEKRGTLVKAGYEKGDMFVDI